MASRSVNSGGPEISTQQERTATPDSSPLRFAGVLVTPITHLLLNLSLGALKGLELGGSKAILFLGSKGKQLGERIIGKTDNVLSKVLKVIGYIIGFPICLVAALPGFVFGALFGVIRGITSICKACRLSLNDGLCYSMKETNVDYYQVDKRKVLAIVTTGCLLVSAAFIGIGYLVAGVPLATLMVTLETPAMVGSTAGLTYLAIDQCQNRNQEELREGF